MRLRKITRTGALRRLKLLRLSVGTRIAGTRPRRDDSGGIASEAAWNRRQRGRATGSFPDAWRVHPALPFAAPARIAVLMHVHYPELVDELVGELAAIPVPFDLIVTNTTGAAITIDSALLPRLRNLAVLELANHGRDILPMVSVVNAGLLDPYHLVLKVHTKHSVWREAHTDLGGSGGEWREGFLKALLGDETNVSDIVGAFAADPDLGVVTADGNVLGPQFWGGDETTTRDVLARIGLTLEPDALKFPAGSMYWIRGLVLQGLRSLALTPSDFEAEAGQVDGTTAHAVERLIGILSTEAGLRIAERSGVSSEGAVHRYDPATPLVRRVRAVPFYLPQFHATPENDRWWGEGFTEWQNVTSAFPIFPGHDQPKLPSALGFYDLRLDEVRSAQMDLATAYGVEGFMYYYYWFAGKRLLSMPIESLHASTLQKPFCIMWANENWTRKWDGRSSDMLIGQDYDEVPATEFIEDVMDFLRDDRYITVDGKKVISVYRVTQIPHYREVFEHWRARAREEGVGELLLINVDVAREFDGLTHNAIESGLDGTHWFPPHNAKWDWIDYQSVGADPLFRGNLLSYGSLVTDAERRVESIEPSIYPAVMVNFDNTARRQWASDIWCGSNPYTFRRWLATTARSIADRDPDQRLVLVNAWNEWAEGAVLEPTTRFGYSYLCAVRDVVYG